MSHPEVGHDVLNRALSKLGEQGLVEKPAGMEGRFLSVILTPSVKKPKPGDDSEPGKDGGPERNSGPSGSNGGVAAQTDGTQASDPSAPADGTDTTEATEEAGT